MLEEEYGHLKAPNTDVGQQRPDRVAGTDVLKTAFLRGKEARGGGDGL